MALAVNDPQRLSETFKAPAASSSTVRGGVAVGQVGAFVKARQEAMAGG